MKKILINAIAIKEGGGAVVFFKTFNEMSRLSENIHWTIIIDERLREKIKTNNNITILVYPWIKKSSVHLLYWNELILPKLIKRMKIDLFYSVINTLPLRRLACTEVLCILQAGYFSEEFTALNRHYNGSIKSKIGWWVRRQWTLLSLKKAEKIISPTKSLSEVITKQLSLPPKKIQVVLPGSGLALGYSAQKRSYPKSSWRIGYITKYGVQKNFYVLFKAAQALKKNGVHFKLVLTLNESHAQFDIVRQLIDSCELHSVIENHGEIADGEIQALYNTLDLFIFPSLCESIGFSLLEAMHYGLPVIASDIASNRELLGDNGIFFQRHHSHELKEKMLLLIENEKYYSEMSVFSIQQSQKYCWSQSAKETIKILSDAAGRCAGC